MMSREALDRTGLMRYSYNLNPKCLGILGELELEIRVARLQRCDLLVGADRLSRVVQQDVVHLPAAGALVPTSRELSATSENLTRL